MPLRNLHTSLDASWSQSLNASDGIIINNVIHVMNYDSGLLELRTRAWGPALSGSRWVFASGLRHLSQLVKLALISSIGRLSGPLRPTLRVRRGELYNS